MGQAAAQDYVEGALFWAGSFSASRNLATEAMAATVDIAMEAPRGLRMK